MVNHSEDSLMEGDRDSETQEKETKQSQSQVIPIDVLPDGVLVEIFDFYMDGEETRKALDAWQSLVHVCHRWRIIVFGSQRRLNLRLYCETRTPVNLLDVWPPLPLVVDEFRYYPSDGPDDPYHRDNVVEALKQSHRVCKIDLTVIRPQLETVWAVMQEPFPELAYLNIQVDIKSEGIPDQVPESFLGGYAPSLQHLHLGLIPFPGLPRLLLSTTHLVTLYLWKIPPSGYISPKAMVTCLTVLTSLENFTLRYYYPFESPDQEDQCALPQARSVLPALTSFDFKGATSYLEDLVAWIDAPRLFNLYIIFFDNLVNHFNNPHLVQFISHNPSFESPEKAHLYLNEFTSRVELSSQTSGYGTLHVGLDSPNRQLTPLAQVCASSLPSLSTVETLCISERHLFAPKLDFDTEGALWLKLLHSFASVKDLYVCQGCVPRIAFALLELERGTAEELPVLRNLFLEGVWTGTFQRCIEDFVAARKLSCRPITVSQWDRSSEKGVCFEF